MNSLSQLHSLTFDEPILYKSLSIWPVKLKEYFFFISVVDVLLIDKNSIPDVQVISMSYLDYVIRYSNKENSQYEKLMSLLMLCLKVKKEDVRVVFNKKGRASLIIGNEEISSDEFEEMKSIILNQNLIPIPDYTIQKEIRDKIEEGKRIKSRGGKKFASIEEQIVSLSVATGLPLEAIYEMTYRKFYKAIEREDMLIHYKIYLQSSMSGFVEFKDKSAIKHWLLEKDSDSNGLISVDSMKEKLSFDDIKKKDKT